MCIFGPIRKPTEGFIKCFFIDTKVVVVRRIFDVLSHPDALLTKVENWDKRGKCTILRGRIDFLNRKGRTNYWDKNYFSELKAVDEQPKLIHLDITSEILGI